MKKTKVIVSAILASSLVSTPLLSEAIYAKEALNNLSVSQDNQVDYTEKDFYDYVDVEIEGEMYFIETIIENETTTIHVTDSNGTITFTTLEGSNHTNVESDFLTNNEITTLENDLQSMVTIEEADEDQIEIMPFAQTGKWMNGRPSNVTVTPNGKFTAQAIISAVGSTLGIYGVAASTFANVMIQYNVKTGYFTKRVDVRRDTNSNYLWQRTQTKLYKESSRKTLLKTSTSSPVKKWIGI
ncbi:hypothetical protein [Oceanobacillus sojae]|uniref:PepSY domain-containing protein n=1 Tax=Oceanobacillus sojae TaxID=582851 RepID=A0A511ZQ05_9BACI|nr:hypothetical protein [Oceanobacillus sojae]GEN89536.1 hypothetical protein OSO01_42750 [Oceanobacillus sojae]